MPQLAIRPDVVGLTGLVVSSHENMREIIDLLRSQAPDEWQITPIVVGGERSTNNCVVMSGQITLSATR